jgi:hypothetical protein
VKYILRRRALLIAALVSHIATPSNILAQAPRPQPSTFLREQLGFSPADLAMLEAGQVIVKLPKTEETREVAAFTIARLDVPGDFYIERLRDIVKFKKNENVLEIGKFSNPPRLGDLDGLTLDQGDIDAIKRCRVKNCDLKMSATFIEKIHKEVNWSAPHYREQVTALVRAMLLAHVQAYLKGGDNALGQYDDKSYKLVLADEVRPLLKPASFMYGYVPEFQHDLEGFPWSRRGGSENFEDFLYWSKEHFGFKPVISVTHVTIHRQSHDKASDAIIASKGIYASHYLEASLGLTAVFSSQASEPARSYLIYVNRSRTDALRGLLGGLKRSLIGGRLRAGAKKNLGMVKQNLEAEYRSRESSRTGAAYK